MAKVSLPLNLAFAAYSKVGMLSVFNSSRPASSQPLAQAALESFARSGTFCLTDLSGKPLLSETLSPNDIAVDALEEAGRRRPARSELKRSKKPCFLCGTARAIRG